MRNRKQSGFTLIELIVVIVFLVSIAIGVGVLYVGGHFLAKFW